MQNVKDATRWFAKPKKRGFDSGRLKTKEKVFQKRDKVTVSSCKSQNDVIGLIVTKKMRLLLPLSRWPHSGQVFQWNGHLIATKLSHKESHKDMFSWTSLSLVNHYPCDNYATRTEEHEGGRCGETWRRSAKHVRGFWTWIHSSATLLPQEPNYSDTPSKRVGDSPSCCGINNLSFPPQTCGSAAYAPFAQD